MAITVVSGPPCGGKSTYVREHAKPGDVIVDFDALAVALGAVGDHQATGPPSEVAFTVRQAAIEKVLADRAPAWIIHTNPTTEQRAEYDKVGADYVMCDPGIETALERCKVVISVSIGWLATEGDVDWVPGFGPSGAACHVFFDVKGESLL